MEFWRTVQRVELLPMTDEPDAPEALRGTAALKPAAAPDTILSATYFGIEYKPVKHPLTETLSGVAMHAAAVPKPTGPVLPKSKS